MSAIKTSKLKFIGNGHTKAVVHDDFNSRWIYVSTENGHNLVCTFDTSLFAEFRGRVRAESISEGEGIVTEEGMYAVVAKKVVDKDDFKMVVTMETGQLYYANGILVHT